jgi:Xaa-Pro aminopeptidase
MERILKQRSVFLLCAMLFILSCKENTVLMPTEVNPFSGPSPWPEIRQERINMLLAPAMERAEVDAWAVLCRSNNNDPMAKHIGGENAIAPAVFLFERRDDEIFSLVFTPPGEASALQELALQDSIIVVDYNVGALSSAAEYINMSIGGVLALNFSNSNPFADGLSHTQYSNFTQMLNPSVKSMIVSSEELIYEWLSIKTPKEVEIMREAAEVTAAWEIEALKAVVPNVTTDKAVADFLKAKMKEYGVTDAWAPDQNPSVNSGQDRGHSHPTDKIIRPGDVIQIDFGIRVFDTWVSDIQRFAYVLRDGEETAPEDIQRYWEVAKAGIRKVRDAMRPGVRGIDVDIVQREWMRENGSEEVFWSTGHSVGYQAHDVGPIIGGGQLNRKPSPNAMRELREGMVFANDGFYKWNLDEGTKTFSVEEMIVVTADGAKFISPPQEELVLIR